MQYTSSIVLFLLFYLYGFYSPGELLFHSSSRADNIILLNASVDGAKLEYDNIIIYYYYQLTASHTYLHTQTPYVCYIVSIQLLRNFSLLVDVHIISRYIVYTSTYNMIGWWNCIHPIWFNSATTSGGSFAIPATHKKNVGPTKFPHDDENGCQFFPRQKLLIIIIHRVSIIRHVLTSVSNVLSTGYIYCITICTIVTVPRGCP